jgi:hypothetical protein
LHPGCGVISAGLEDDFHHFEIHLAFDDGSITAIAADAMRFPWSTCGGAGDFLAKALVGRSLSAIAALDAFTHCTHLYDLAGLAAAHAEDAEPCQFDMFVTDRRDESCSATLKRDGADVLDWSLHGTVIETPENWAGIDLRQLSSLRGQLPPHLVEAAFILRRAIFVSGGRTTPAAHSIQRPSDLGPQRQGVCYTYQSKRSGIASRTPHWWRDFSGAPDTLLQSFRPRAPT